MMKLYILEPRKAWMPWYDKMFGVVVRAKNSSNARQVASAYKGDEGFAVWLDPKLTTCKRLKDGGKAGVVIRNFQGA